MQNIELFVNCLEYIEQHIGDISKTEEIARECFCSKSTLEKLFRCVNGISVQDYIKRRRMVLAAKRIAENPDVAILAVALEYGYASNEAFTRAFKEVWNCLPSELRGKKVYNLYPKLNKPITEGSELMKQKKNVDITELYDLFTERKNCWFICCDIKSLIPINEISRKAGDLAILESMNRMNDAAGDNDMVFRIGGDEFCMLTDTESDEYADSIVSKIQQLNGVPFLYESQEIPLSLYAVKTKVQGSHVRYNELFQDLHVALNDGKQSPEIERK